MSDLNTKLEQLKEIFSHSKDFKTQAYKTQDGNEFAIAFIDNVIDQLILSNNIINPLLTISSESDKDFVTTCKEKIIEFSQVTEAQTLDDLSKSIVNGFCGIIFPDSEVSLSAEVSKWPKRAPEEPPTSAVINGPREGFVEDINTNVALLRKRLKTPKLKVDSLTLGTRTNSIVRIVYLQDVASPEVINKVKERLNKISIDGIIDSNYLISFLQPSKHTIFKQIGKCEKPDIAAAKILEGRLAILVDGSPIALTLPYILFEDLQNSNDYYSVPFRATFLRYLRFFGAILAILLPGIYVALLMYHLKAIPIKLLISITNSIQGIPLPPLLEMLFIIFLFEVLYEASLRMPRYLGLALSVVGALILGDTAVQAGLISPPGVLIVAITGVMSYTLPEQSNQISLLRLIFTVIGGVFGIFGIIVGVLFLLGYLANMDSYGSPYLAPYAPNIPSDKKDGMRRQPIPHMTKRPKSIQNINERRQGKK